MNVLLFPKPVSLLMSPRSLIYFLSLNAAFSRTHPMQWITQSWKLYFSNINRLLLLLPTAIPTTFIWSTNISQLYFKSNNSSPIHSLHCILQWFFKSVITFVSVRCYLHQKKSNLIPRYREDMIFWNKIHIRWFSIQRGTNPSAGPGECHLLYPSREAEAVSHLKPWQEKILSLGKYRVGRDIRGNCRDCVC